MVRQLAIFVGLLAANVSLVPADAADPVVPGLTELCRLDLLPRFKPSVFVGSVSSYDRTGGNDDGFSGQYSYVAKVDGGLVIADLQGPGVIYRIWTPTPSDDWFEFYFDGETTPRIRVKFGDIFTGVQAPFVAPLVGFGAGGFYCYVPLPYQKSCKIVARAERVQFYQINYATYPDDVPIATWTADADAEQIALQQARAGVVRVGRRGSQPECRTGRRDLRNACAAGVACARIHGDAVRIADWRSHRRNAYHAGDSPGREGTRSGPADHLGRPAARGGVVSGRRLLRLRLGATGHSLVVRGHGGKQQLLLFPHAIRQVGED